MKKIMRTILLTMALSFLPVITFAQNTVDDLNSSMQEYHAACLKLREAFQTRDKETIKESVELMQNCNAGSINLTEYIVIESARPTQEGHLRFDTSSAFSLAEEAGIETEGEEGEMDEFHEYAVWYLNVSIPAHKRLSYYITGNGKKEMFVMTEAGQKAIFTVTNEEDGTKNIGEGSDIIKTWELPSGGSAIITVENPTDKAYSVVVASN